MLIWYGLWISRSSMASAKVGAPMAVCHWSIGSWLTAMVARRPWRSDQLEHDLDPTRNIQRCPDNRYCEPRAGDADGDPILVERRTHCRNRGWRRTRSDGRDLDDDGAPRFRRGLRVVPLLVRRRQGRRDCLSSIHRVPDVEECRRPYQGRDQVVLFLLGSAFPGCPPKEANRHQEYQGERNQRDPPPCGYPGRIREHEAEYECRKHDTEHHAPGSI